MKAGRVVLATLALILLLQGAACAGAAIGGNKAVMVGGPYEVEKVTNLAYYDGADADPVRHRLDVYYPKGQKDYPVLFFVHGGAWRFGNKDMYAALGNTFAKNGVGVVITNYRLSPKVQHPGHIEDVARAFAWAHKNVGTYGGRSDQLFVCGHSAGGHLVALLATDESYLKAHGLSLKDIKGAIPMSGVYVVSPLLQEAFGKDTAVHKKASPQTHVQGNHPPALIIYADKDYLTIDTMSEQFCKKLKDNKCQAATLKVADRTHITIIVSFAANEGDPATQAVLQFIATHGSLKLREKDGKKAGG
jgi:acetyl esterase/lipase